MEVPIDQFKTLVDVFGGVLETYLEAYLKEHPDAGYVYIDPNDVLFTKLVNALLNKIPADEKVLCYSSSVVLFPDTKFSIADLERACQLGHLRYAKWLELKPTQRAADLAIQGDHVDVVEWCISDPTLCITTRLIYEYDAINIAISSGKISNMKLSLACIAGSIKIAKHLRHQKPDNTAWLFINACQKGHLDVAQWLITQWPETKVHVRNENEFLYACHDGHLDVAQWLVTQWPETNVHVMDDIAFRHACENGHLDVAQWLVTQWPETEVHAQDDYAFRSACKNGHVEIAIMIIKHNTHMDDDTFKKYFHIAQIPADKSVIKYMYKELPLPKGLIEKAEKILNV